MVGTSSVSSSVAVSVEFARALNFYRFHGESHQTRRVGTAPGADGEEMPGELEFAVALEDRDGEFAVVDSGLGCDLEVHPVVGAVGDGDHEGSQTKGRAPARADVGDPLTRGTAGTSQRLMQGTIELELEMLTGIIFCAEEKVEPLRDPAGFDFLAQREERGVEARADAFKEWLSVDEADIDGPRHAGGDHSRGLERIRGETGAAGEIVVGAAGDDSQRDGRTRQRAGDGFDGAIPAGYGDPCRARLAGRASERYGIAALGKFVELRAGRQLRQQPPGGKFRRGAGGGVVDEEAGHFYRRITKRGAPLFSFPSGIRQLRTAERRGRRAGRAGIRPRCGRGAN